VYDARKRAKKPAKTFTSICWHRTQQVGPDMPHGIAAGAHACYDVLVGGIFFI